MTINKNERSAWITWEVQVRNRSLSKLLGVQLFEFNLNYHRAIKYPILIIKTFLAIYKNNLKTIFVQNPSIVLSMLSIILRPLFGLRVIVDAHNSGVYPLEGKNRLLNFFAKFIARKADCVIVSNVHLATIIRGWGATAIVMPDPVPELSLSNEPNHAPIEDYALFICTWAEDEPYFEVINAAEKITANLKIYITGNYKKKLSPEFVSSLTEKVKLLGFVSEEDYVDIFSKAKLAIDLTTRDNCLVCGAYEALALQVPCIISDSRVNREIFCNGFSYTHNDAQSIALTIDELLANIQQKREAIKEQAHNHTKNVLQQVASIKNTFQLM